MSVVVAGGGLAGAAAACLLAQGGQTVLLLERDAAPVDKICGEFISTEAQDDLARLGLDLAALGARRISRVRLARGDRLAVAALPFVARSLTRRVLDAALLDLAAASGADIRRGHAALRLDGDPMALRVAGLGTLNPEALFLATGKHDLRGARRRLVQPPEALVGFKLHLRLTPFQSRAMDDHVDVMLFPDGYAGLQLVEGGRANLCLLAGEARLQRAGGAWDRLLEDLCRESPHLAARLAGAEVPAARPLTIAQVPYGFVHAATPSDPPGLFRLGDQMGVIPSFTGDGMAIALHSARRAAACHLAGRPAGDYHAGIRRDIAPQIGRAMALYRFGRLPAGQATLMRLAAVWPGALAAAATLTRLPAQARAA